MFGLSSPEARHVERVMIIPQQRVDRHLGDAHLLDERLPVLRGGRRQLGERERILGPCPVICLDRISYHTIMVDEYTRRGAGDPRYPKPHREDTATLSLLEGLPNIA